MFGCTGAAWEFGKEEHLPACMAGVDGDSDSLPIAQRCFPLRRQHDGSFESASKANTAGLISEKLKRADSRTARMRRIRLQCSPRQGLLPRVHRQSWERLQPVTARERGTASLLNR